MVLPRADGLSATWMPALRNASNLAAAVSRPPEMTAPAWPIRRPGGAVAPAMKPTTGFLVPDAWMNSAASISRGPADLADHHDALRLRVGQEQLEHLDEVRALHRVAADPDARALPQPRRRGLRDRLVGERAGAADDAHRAAPVDVARHDADLARLGRDDAGTVGTNQPRLAALERPLDPHHVENRDALGDADDQRHLGFHRLQDRVRGVGRGHVDRARRRPCCVNRLGHRVEHGQVQVRACRPCPA